MSRKSCFLTQRVLILSVVNNFKNMKKEKKDQPNNQEENNQWETKKIEEKNNKENTEKKSSSKEKPLFKKAGELAVDVYSTEKNIIIQAPVGGVKKDDLEIVTEKDMVIIKGNRERPKDEEIVDFYTNECFYGFFRREVVLPEETDPSRLEADIKEGVLTIKAPKIEREKRRKVEI